MTSQSTLPGDTTVITYGRGFLQAILWEEYGYAAWICTDSIWRAKAQIELNLVRDVKNNKEALYRYRDQKRQPKESTTPLLMEKELATKDMEKAEVLSQ